MTTCDLEGDIELDGGDTFRVYECLNDKGPLFVFHHGAGHSARVWSLLMVEMKKYAAEKVSGFDFSALCFDARGHGLTKCADEGLLSLEQLTDDLIALVSKRARDGQEIVFVGHSLGGSVVVNAVSRNVLKNVVGAVVIDVVEGTAIESLAHMKHILKSKPSKFKSVKEAINWRHVSLSPTIVDGISKTVCSTTNFTIGRQPKYQYPHNLLNQDGNLYKWRTDLAPSEPYWQGWFENLSEKFLSMKCGRLLVIAGTERLDKPLTIGQMQGKFQMIVYPESGHCVQEDVPHKLAGGLLEFWARNQRNVGIKRFPIPPKKETRNE